MTLALPRSDARTYTSAQITRARLAVYSTFAIAGMLFASWVPRIPEMKDRLDLSASSLGLALLAPSIGSLLAMNAVGALTARIGTGPATRIFALLFCGLAWLPGLAQSYPMFWGFMFLWGLGVGGLDVSMNAQAVSVEKRHGRPLMSGFHAAWSLGSLIGAGVGTLGAARHLPISAQQLVFAIVLAALALYVSRFYVSEPGATDEPISERPEHAAAPVVSGTQSRWRRGPFADLDLRLVLLGLAGLGAMLSEGSVADWSGILLRDSLHSPASHVGLAFAAFMATETLGRLFGDRIVVWLGRVRAISIMATIGTLGLAAGLATGTLVGAITGFALLGLGLSIMVPVAFSAAADGRPHAGPAIAAVSTLAYSGFLAGPTAIGFVADATTITTAMWLIPVITALAGIFSVAALRRRTPGIPGIPGILSA
ncbi:MAG: putative transporter [Pseudonocardiales bacterium]|nr:putative transporter [Pseudonocardiales bacterium]